MTITKSEGGITSIIIKYKTNKYGCIYEKNFDFESINQYDTYIINVNKKDYEKMQECIYNLTKKYGGMI